MSVNQYQNVEEKINGNSFKGSSDLRSQNILTLFFKLMMKTIGFPESSSQQVHSTSYQKEPLNIKPMVKVFKKKLISLFIFRIRLMPMVIFFAVLVLGARFSTLVTHLGEKDFMKKAHASAVQGAKKQIPLSKLDKAPDVKSEKLKGMSDFDPFNMTADQYRVLKGVVAKTDHLSDRERSISEKEQLLKALVRKMDDKVKELRKAKSELAAMVNKIGEEENANTKRLVKMTESMKPVKAAEVLQGIEFPILLEIMEKVKAKKASAILSAMDPKKASYLMTALSKRRKVFNKSDPSKSIMQ